MGQQGSFLGQQESFRGQHGSFLGQQQFTLEQQLDLLRFLQGDFEGVHLLRGLHFLLHVLDLRRLDGLRQYAGGLGGGVGHLCGLLFSRL